MNNQPCKITATVERVRWPKDATEPAANAKQFYILATSAGVAKGCLTHRPRSGEALVLDGRWEVSKYNGQPEFVFVHAAVNVPADPRALLHYACTLTPSFGDAREAAIWQARGEDWRNLSLDDNIRGVTPSALEAFRKTIAFLVSHSARASSVAWLVSIGLTVNMADAAVDKFGDEVVARVTADPYILALLPHYSFKAADDHLRPFFKIDRDSPLRIRAALRYALSSLLESDTAVTWRELSAATVALIDSDVDAISAIARQMIQSNELCAFARTERLTLLRLFVAEAEIYRYIAGNVVYKDAPRARQPRGCGFKLDADQMAAVQFAVQHRFAIINGSAGTGKCLGKGTPVVMYNMTIKKVEDVCIGDILLGPNGEMKHVTSVTKGREEMFRITPNRGGEAFTCNRSHILSVLHTRSRIRDYTDDAKKCFNISVEEIFTKLKPEYRKHLKCWHSDCIGRPTQNILVDPYFLGVWLGDGCQRKGVIRITNPDKEIIDWLFAYAKRIGVKAKLRLPCAGRSCPTIELVSPLGRVRGFNVLSVAMRKLDLFDNKHIPHSYIDNSEKVRLELLAGLLDTDGYYDSGVYEITQKSERLANDIAFLARSLGLSVSLSPCRKQCCNNGVWGDYFRLVISGELDKIPCLVERKKAKPRKQIKNPRVSGITIEPIGVGDYYGFTLAEEDGLFLLGDFTVTHNTSIVRAICDTLGEEGAWLCAFAGKAAARLREATGHDASTIHRMLGWQGEGRGFTLSTFPPRTTVVVDEASMVASDLMAEIVKRSPYRLILVGDEAQLPPVGFGQPFHDAIALFPACVRTLGLCYRNREAVFSSALAVRNGFMPPASAKSDAELYEFTSTRSPADSHLAILSAVRSGVVDFDSDIILVCRNGESTTDPLTVQALNADIKTIVNPAPDGRIAITPGDRVMCVKNCADLDVWNGTTGRCRGFDCDRAMWVDLDYPNAAGETSVLIPKEKVKEWVLAYALTVHKAQGSQYRRVWIGISRRDIPSRLLDRAMLYTAITRARSECRIYGDAWAFASAVGLVPTKHTVMQELAREAKEKEAK